MNIAENVIPRDLLVAVGIVDCDHIRLVGRGTVIEGLDESYIPGCDLFVDYSVCMNRHVRQAMDVDHLVCLDERNETLLVHQLGLDEGGSLRLVHRLDLVEVVVSVDSVDSVVSGCSRYTDLTPVLLALVRGYLRKISCLLSSVLDVLTQAAHQD